VNNGFDLHRAPIGIDGFSNKFAVVIATFALIGICRSADSQQNYCCGQRCEVAAHYGPEFFNGGHQ
jgi:hypothetical protein